MQPQPPQLLGQILSGVVVVVVVEEEEEEWVAFFPKSRFGNLCFMSLFSASYRAERN
jgi:hypothetical protein